MFDIDSLKFTYTLGDVWVSPGAEKAKPDTLITGSIRQSSIDSIMDLIKDLKDTTIDKIETGISSGGIAYLSIFADHNDICYKLFNAYNATADKIAAILNTYIPPSFDKVCIPNWRKEK